MSEPQGNKSTDDRLWIWLEQSGLPRVSFVKPQAPIKADEYMRVLPRQEVEKLASGEGVDVQQLLNSYRRTIEGQRRHIASLQEDNARLRNATEDLKRDRDRAQQHYEIAKAGMLAAREGQ